MGKTHTYPFQVDRTQLVPKHCMHIPHTTPYPNTRAGISFGVILIDHMIVIPPSI